MLLATFPLYLSYLRRDTILFPHIRQSATSAHSVSPYHQQHPDGAPTLAFRPKADMIYKLRIIATFQHRAMQSHDLVLGRTTRLRPKFPTLGIPAFRSARTTWEELVPDGSSPLEAAQGRDLCSLISKVWPRGCFDEHVRDLEYTLEYTTLVIPDLSRLAFNPVILLAPDNHHCIANKVGRASIADFSLRGTRIPRSGLHSPSR